MVAIQVQKVHFAFDGRTVLQNVSLQVPTGDFTVLLGKNGCGKSTLLKVVADLLSEVYGTPIEAIPFRDRALVVPF